VSVGAIAIFTASPPTTLQPEPQPLTSWVASAGEGDCTSAGLKAAWAPKGAALPLQAVSY